MTRNKIINGEKIILKFFSEEHFFMKEPIVRFDKAGSAEVRLDRNTPNKPVVRSNFNTIKKRISGRI